MVAPAFADITKADALEKKAGLPAQNDVAIISEWKYTELDAILLILNRFYLESELKINLHKSSLIGIGVNFNEVELLAAKTGCTATSTPFTFLGFNLGENMSRASSWTPIIDKYKARLPSWTAKMLLTGGRLTLIKFVLGRIM
ncbi:uncharacterized protein [Rutidosis leptorrhynchoides]|uniref:uncharacterized protein n=1 Tax=Rutidosis leptorrhynchoides TaxID=125765 RepID=UPI003A99A6EC